MNKLVEKKVFEDIEYWKDKIESAGEPKDDFERVRLHYLCTHHYLSNTARIKNNLIAALSILPVLILYRIKSVWKVQELEKAAVVYSPDPSSQFSKESLPDELKNEYKDIENIEIKKSIKNGLIDKDTWKLILQFIKRYPFSFDMNLFCIYQLAYVDFLIHKYKPAAVICEREENNAAVTLMTKLCEIKKSEYIVIMHGEYFFEPFHAFLRVSRFYCWDQYYVCQFLKLKAKASFHVFIPERYRKEIKRDPIPQYYIGYYLQTQTEDELVSLRNILEGLIRQGKACKVRPHKRATNMDILTRVFENSNIDIEDYERIPIEKSFENTKYIIAQYSTVLSEAYEYGLQPVLDDVTNPLLFEKLKTAMYINVERIKLRLSDLL